MKIRTLIISLLILSGITYSQIKVACVGNSITYGAGIEGRDSLAYPQQLAKILGEAYEVKNFGHSGATMLKNGNKPYWNLPEFKAAKEFKPDIVIIMLGTNDSKPDNWEIYKNEYTKDYTEMITVFKNLETDPLIYLALPIPVVKDQWTIRKDIVEIEISNRIKNLAKDLGLQTIDFFSVFKEKYDLIPDNIHPDAEGSRLMAEVAAKAILAEK